MHYPVHSRLSGRQLLAMLIIGLVLAVSFLSANAQQALPPSGATIGGTIYRCAKNRDGTYDCKVYYTPPNASVSPTQEAEVLTAASGATLGGTVAAHGKSAGCRRIGKTGDTVWIECGPA